MTLSWSFSGFRARPSTAGCDLGYRHKLLTCTLPSAADGSSFKGATAAPCVAAGDILWSNWSSGFEPAVQGVADDV